MKDPHPKIAQDKFTPYIYPIKKKLQLNRHIESKSKYFLEVILSRESTRVFTKFTELDLEKLLHYCCQIKSIDFDETGFILTKRTTPSAGSRHPVDLLISMPHNLRTLSYYNPLDHTLGELQIERNKLDNFFLTINKNLPIQNACIIWFSIQTGKTASKYHNPESLYWRDAGALIYALQLIVTYLGFKSCPIGTLSSDTFNELFQDENLLSGGGILISN